MSQTREQRTEQAFFRGGSLTLRNPRYRTTFSALIETLLRDDLAPNDLTVRALGMAERRVNAAIVARQAGVVAGIEELTFLFRERGVEAVAEKRDGEIVKPDEVVIRLKGPEQKMLGLERTALNLLQRMSGIATAAHCLQERLRKSGSRAKVIGTRKTPWGLLDKRALHVGGVGTHRLGLGDAILIKNNHLALLGASEQESAPIAIERAWQFRSEAAFIEVEVRTEEGARAAVDAYHGLQKHAGGDFACLMLLDNMIPDQIAGIVAMLQRENVWDSVLIEASGGISELNIEAYAASGADAISIGALTHSARALDISLRIS
jgi:nicotinate-nucleotide pyrophosphorylase (carboxylating)